MEKRFIVKGVVSDYGVFDTKYGDGECLDCICSAKANADLIADILNTDYSKPNECTYYENELQQENKQLKERIQNILEGKEIPAICAKKYEEYEEQLAEKDKEIEKLKETLDLYLNPEDFIMQIRKQVCDEIKREITNLENLEQAKESINENRNKI